jgi:antitoxin (DNA-binding transcriptional repressor) of toxin-antitoxin stability system
MMLRKMHNTQRIPATHAVRSFSDLLNRAAFAGEHFIIERYGKPLALLSPMNSEPTSDPARLEPTPHASKALPQPAIDGA